jgi:hypothetical protein
MKDSLLLATVFLGGCLIAQADVGDGKQAPPPAQPPSYTYPQPQQPPPAYYYPAPPPAYYYGVPVFIGGFSPPFFGPYFRGGPRSFGGYRGFYHRSYFRGYRGGGYYYGH